MTLPKTFSTSLLFYRKAVLLVLFGVISSCNFSALSNLNKRDNAPYTPLPATYPSRYETYQKPYSKKYSNPYSMPPKNYYPYYDSDQYYVPPSNYYRYDQDSAAPSGGADTKY